MISDERCNLVLTFARTLFVNGQATDQAVAAAERLGRALGLRANVMARWGELQLLSDSETTPFCEAPSDPAGVDMDRVASTMRAIEEVESGRLKPDVATKAIGVISRAPPAPNWLFALAAAAGAVALSVIFGVGHFLPAVVIFVSAGAGAILRRAVARLSANDFIQPFCAAILAGLIGALAVRYDLSSSLRLVAVCPCMVLVPGPHFLNGALDLIGGRIHLGAARLVYAGLIVVAISTGLLLGLALLGASLPVDPPGRTVPLWLDVIAAGVAVASYSVFFSTPLNMLPRTQRVRFRRRRWRAGRLHRRWTDTHSSLAPLAHAVCGHRLRLRRVDAAGRVPLQDDERACTDRRRRPDDVVADSGDHLRRNDRLDHHFGNEPGSHHSEDDRRLPWKPINANKNHGSG